MREVLLYIYVYKYRSIENIYYIKEYVNIDINRNCNSVILENPYKIDFKLLFSDYFSDDNEEDLNNSI